MEQLQKLENQSKFNEIITCTDGVTDDPKLLYYRAVALQATGNPVQAADVFAATINKTSSLKFKAILKLKQLCIEHCELYCEDRYNKMIFGKDGVVYLQNLTSWRAAVLANPTIEQLDLLLEKCSGDSQLAIMKMRYLLYEGKFADARALLKNVYEPELFTQLDRMSSAIDFTFSAFCSEAESGANSSALARLCYIQNVLGSATLLTHKPKGLTRLVREVSELDLAQVFTELREVQKDLEASLSRIYRTDFILPLDTFFSQLESYLALIPGALYLLRNETIFGELDDRYNSSANAIALTSVYRAFEIYNAATALRYRFAARVDIDEELQALEQQSEAVRKALTGVKFSRVGDQLRYIDNFIDEINAVFDYVTQLRLDTLVPDFYYILNVTRDSTLAEIKRNYYKKAQTLHPDNLPADLAPNERKTKQREFQLVAEAYSVLTDKNKRDLYEYGMYGAEEKSYRVGIHNNRKYAAYTTSPDYVGKGNMISDEELRKFMSEQQWNEYMRNKKFGRT